ncbi:MAG TPA: amino acid permease [Acidobacteriaceae bacterium]|nr:amino acid permease [Acidobacteriaceae bacterium]
MTPEKILAQVPGAVLHADDKLKRVIGPWGLGTSAVNIAVGAGIFVVPAFVAAILGPAAIVAYFVCGIAGALVLTCYIEIGSFVHRSGGGIAYVEEAFGPLMGFLAWMMYLVGYEVTACAALAVALLSSLAFWVPALGHGAPRVLTLLLVFGGLTAVNIIGVRQGLRVAVASTVAKLVPLLLAIVAGIFFVHWHQLRWVGWPPAAKLGEASLILFFAFQGIEEALAPSAEIRDPARTVPRAMFGATGTVILLYVALQLVSQGVLGGQLAQQTTAPLAAVAGRVVGVAGSTLVMIGVAVSIFGSLAGGLLSTPRAFFLAAEDGMLPRALAQVHPRFRTPHVAILTVATLMFLLAASGGFKHLAILSSTSILCVYLAICLGALKLRYTRKREPGAFRAPGGPLIGILGSIMVIWLLSHSTRVEVRALSGSLAVSIAYFFARRWYLKRRGETIR